MLRRCTSIRNKVIVFGSNHLNALGIVRGLGQNGVSPICILTENNRGFVFDSKYPALCVFQQDAAEGLDYIIQHYGNEEEKPIIIPSCDYVVHLLDINYEYLSKLFYIHHAGEAGRLTSYMGKNQVGILATKNNLLIPQSWVYKKGESIPSVKYPCFVKALSSLYSKRKVAEICYSYKELESVIKTVPCSQLIIQELIDKKDELCLMGFSINRGNDLYIPYKMNYLQLPTKTFGAKVLMTKFTDNNLYAVIKKMMKEIGFEGLFSIEFIIDKNWNKYFTEINFRNDGYSYFATKGGISLPYYYCLSLLKGQLVLPNKKIKQKLTGINELYYYAQTRKQISFFGFIKDLIEADALLLCDFKDIKPIFHPRVGYVPDNQN